jgi:hypothetical protein
VAVTAGGTNLTVTIDGVKVLDTPVTVPPNAYAGFSGTTGGATDVHKVSNIDIVY